MNEDELIQAIRLRLTMPDRTVREERTPYPPLTESEYHQFQERIKYPLPNLFRRNYMEIGDGGWGPWNGFGRSGIRGDEHEPWFSVLGIWNSRTNGDIENPQCFSQRLAFCDWGCTVFTVLDLQSGIVGIEDDIVQWQANSIHQWLEKWLSGKNLFSEVKKA